MSAVSKAADRSSYSRTRKKACIGCAVQVVVQHFQQCSHCWMIALLSLLKLAEVWYYFWNGVEIWDVSNAICEQRWTQFNDGSRDGALGNDAAVMALINHTTSTCVDGSKLSLGTQCLVLFSWSCRTVISCLTAECTPLVTELCGFLWCEVYHVQQPSSRESFTAWTLSL